MRIVLEPRAGLTAAELSDRVRHLLTTVVGSAPVGGNAIALTWDEDGDAAAFGATVAAAGHYLETGEELAP